MGFRYLVKKHVGTGMMVQTFLNRIIKMNHLSFNELFKKRKTFVCWGQYKIKCHLKVLLEREGVVVDSC
jgi:hypothetical protein